jgi:hypothetical protein
VLCLVGELKLTPLSYPPSSCSWGKPIVINPLKTSILLLASLVLFSNQPQFKAERKVSSVSVFQPNPVDVRQQMPGWTGNSNPAFQALPSPLPAIAAPALPNLTSQRHALIANANRYFLRTAQVGGGK